MDKEMLDILNVLSKKPTTELALQIMELSGENLILEQQCKKQKEVIDKAIEYISNKKAIINTDVIRIFDLFEIDEQGYTNELLDILKEVKK
jgi:hypothetical protein